MMTNDEETPLPGYHTTLEVAKMLGLAVRSVQLMVDRGDLQAWKTPGGHRRITRESLERWLKGNHPSQLAQIGSSDLHPTVRRLITAHVPKILLIEDSVHYQNLVALLIKQRFGHVELQIAHDSITGLVSFGQFRPDLVLVDILLPGIDGITMITGLRRHALLDQCQLIVLTSLDLDQRGPYAFALQDLDVVHKPKLVTDLPPLIEQALKRLDV